jgi:cytoskeletal protein RodZ
MSKIPSTEEQENQSKKSKLDPTIVVSVVTLIGTVLTAVLASPVLIAWIQKTPDAKTSSPQPTSVTSVAPSAENQTPNKSKPSPDVSSSILAPTSMQAVCITSLDNPQVPIAVDANSLIFNGGPHLTLMSGQSIPFTKMRQFQVTDVITSPPPVIRVTSIKMVITLLDGTIISDVLDGNGHLNGKAKFSGFGKSLDKIKTVEFKEQPTC